MCHFSLTLEEMDLVFGSSGVAVADQERMRQIYVEIGLTRAMGLHDAGSDDEKIANREDDTYEVREKATA